MDSQQYTAGIRGSAPAEARSTGLVEVIRQSETIAARAETLVNQYGTRLERIMFPEGPEKPVGLAQLDRAVAPGFDVIRKQLIRVEGALDVLERFLSRLDV